MKIEQVSEELRNVEPLSKADRINLCDEVEMNRADQAREARQSKHLANTHLRKRYSFFIPGSPKPQGSKTVYRIIKKQADGETSSEFNVKDSAGEPLELWRAICAQTALHKRRGEIISGPVVMDLRFVFKGPKAHYRTGRNAGKLKQSAPEYHTHRPDRLKLPRAVEDAFTGTREISR